MTTLKEMLLNEVSHAHYSAICSIDDLKDILQRAGADNIASVEIKSAYDTVLDDIDYLCTLCQMLAHQIV